MYIAWAPFRITIYRMEPPMIWPTHVAIIIGVSNLVFTGVTWAKELSISILLGFTLKCTPKYRIFPSFSLFNFRLNCSGPLKLS
jgi:hypothetical protein